MTEWFALATLFLASSQQPAARETCRPMVTERSTAVLLVPVGFAFAIW
jgi:hypothetical protein